MKLKTISRSICICTAVPRCECEGVWWGWRTAGNFYHKTCTDISSVAGREEEAGTGGSIGRASGLTARGAGGEWGGCRSPGASPGTGGSCWAPAGARVGGRGATAGTWRAGSSSLPWCSGMAGPLRETTATSADPEASSELAPRREEERPTCRILGRTSCVSLVYRARSARSWWAGLKTRYERSVGRR